MKDNTPSDETGLNRRTVLRKTALAGTASMALPAMGTGSVSAREAEISRADYDTPELARAAVEEHGAEVLEKLSNRGYIQEASTAALPVGEFARYGHGEEVGLKVFGKSGSTDLPSDEILVVKKGEGTTIRLVVRPHNGHAFAVVEEGDSVEHITPAGDVEPDGCSTHDECSNDDTRCDAGGCWGYERTCCYSGGYVTDCWNHDSGCFCTCS